jgi:hypothetical protein
MGGRDFSRCLLIGFEPPHQQSEKPIASAVFFILLFVDAN